MVVVSFLLIRLRYVYRIVNMYGILDIEGIQRDKEHVCIRKFYILASDGVIDCEREFNVCLPFQKLEKKYQTAFIFCKNKIHKLNYYPKRLSMPCSLAVDTLRTFAEENGIKIVFFKGGIIERRLCEKAGVKYFDIGRLVPKVNCHDPRTEVHLHFDYLTLNCKEEIEKIISR